MLTTIVAAIIALAAGYVIAHFIFGRKISALTTELATRTAEVAARAAEVARRETDLKTANDSVKEAREKESVASSDLARLTERLVQEQKQAEEKLALLTRASKEMQDAFSSLAAEALKTNNSSFLDLARTRLETFQQEAKGELEKREKAVADLVKPIGESLKAVDEQVRTIEKERAGAYGAIANQLRVLEETQQSLRGETSKLVQALRQPQGRGRWGEIQLRRVVEMAGMLNYCDFIEQASVTDADQKTLRPDLIARLPGGKSIVVDSKTPLSAYLEAIEAPDEATRRERLLAHANQVRNHMKALCAKSYQEQFHPTPDFVVMFLPGEFLFSSALEQMPDLIEVGVDQKVIPASPTTLIALLRAVAYGWQQASLAENAQKISALGKRLYESIRVMAGHMEKLGDSLSNSVKKYNDTVGSLERNVLSSARKFPELGVASTEEIAELEPKEDAVRALQSPDWEDSEQAKLDT